MHANSAQSVSCRNSVHAQDILRRLLNNSPLLDWKTCVVPRMMQCGNPEKYGGYSQECSEDISWVIHAELGWGGPVIA